MIDWDRVMDRVHELLSRESTLYKILYNHCYPKGECDGYYIDIEWLAHQSPLLIKALFTDQQRLEDLLKIELIMRDLPHNLPIRFVLSSLRGKDEFTGPTDIFHPAAIRKLTALGKPTVVRFSGRVSAIRQSGDALIYVGGYECHDCGNVMYRFFTPGKPMPEPQTCTECGGRNIHLNTSISKIVDFHEFETVIEDPDTGEQASIPVIFVFEDESPGENLPRLGEDLLITGILRPSHFTKEQVTPVVEAFRVEKISPPPEKLQSVEKLSAPSRKELADKLKNVPYPALAEYLLPGDAPTDEKLLLLSLLIMPFKKEDTAISPSVLFVGTHETLPSSRIFRSAMQYRELGPWFVGYYDALVREEPLLLQKEKELSPIFGKKLITLRARDVVLYKWGTVLIDHGESLPQKELGRIALWVDLGEITDEIGRWVRYSITGGTRVAINMRLSGRFKDPRRALNRKFKYPDHAKFWFVYLEDELPSKEAVEIPEALQNEDRLGILYLAQIHAPTVEVDKERFMEFLDWFTENRESAVKWGGFRLLTGLKYLAKSIAALKLKGTVDDEVLEVLQSISRHLI